MTVSVTFVSKLFTFGIEQLNITTGEHFDYTIPKSILVEDDETLRMELGDLKEWLKFDPTTLTIQGTIPNDVSLQNAEVSLNAASSDGELTDTQTFHVRFFTSSSPPSVTNPANTDSDQPDTNTGPDSHEGSSTGKKAGIVVGSVVAALVLSFVITASAFVFCRRRKYKRGYFSNEARRNPRKSQISGPIMRMEEPGYFDRGHDFDLEMGKDNDVFKRTPEIRPHDFTETATDLAGRVSPVSPLQHKRNTKRMSRNSPLSNPESPVHSRLKSIDHDRARHARSLSCNTNDLLTTRRSGGSSSWTTNTMSRVPTIQSVHPQSAIARHTTQLTTPLEKRRSIRPIPASTTSDSLVDKRSEFEKRLSYIRKRRSTKSPFFGGASSRLSSGSYQTASVAEPSPRPTTALAPKSPKIVKPSDEVERTSTDLPGM